MRCAIYRRVSTDMQAEEGFSLEAQRNRLLAYAESQGWTVVADYCDEGYSAKSLDRPAMQQMINDIKDRKFDVVLVYRLDRLVRSVLDLHELLQLMERYDVRFKSATEIFDTTSATGRLFITLIATLAQWERETIAERVHMGQLKKAEQGGRNGAPAPYGYDLVDGKLVVNEEEAKWVRYIFDRYQSVGAQNIARELNRRGIRTKKGEVWSDFSVRYVLRNPIYAGFVRWNYETTAKGHRKKTGAEVLTPINQEDFVPLIDKKQFDEIQELLKRRSNIAFRSDNFYPFSGILKCVRCGYGMSGATKLKNDYRYYKCRGRINFGICDMPLISEEAVEQEFLKVLEGIEVEFQHLIPAKIEMSQEDIQRQLIRLNQKKERVKELYIEGDITKERYTQIMEEIKAEEKALFEAENKVITERTIEEAKQMLRNLKNEWHHFSYETKKKAINSLFESITIEYVGGRGRNMKVAVVDYKLK